MNSTGICLEQTLAALRQWVAEREGDDAKVIEGAAEPTALPEREAEAANLIEGTAEPVAESQSPEATPEPPQKHKSNRLMREADMAVGPWERKPRMRKVPSPPVA